VDVWRIVWCRGQVKGSVAKGDKRQSTAFEKNAVKVFRHTLHRKSHKVGALGLKLQIQCCRWTFIVVTQFCYETTCA